MPVASPTTLALAVANLATVVQTIAPSSLTERTFVRIPRKYVLRDFVAAGAGVQSFRKFEIQRPGSTEHPGAMDPAVTLKVKELDLVIAYPSQVPGLYGEDGLDDLEDVIDGDADTLWTAIFHPENLIDGVILQEPQSPAVERGDSVWFLTIPVRVHLYVGTELT